MEKIKSLKIVLLVLFVVAILVIVRTTNKNRFKQDAQNAVETVVSDNLLVTTNDLKKNENQYLVVVLDETESLPYKNSLKINFDKLLEDSSLQKLKETKSKILLASTDNSKAVKAWVILNQLAYKNVFVLTSEENPEVLKYKFQPDTTAEIEISEQSNE